MAQIRAEHRKIGYLALVHLPPKTMPEGKVAVHIPPGDRSWVQILTDDIEPCDCGWSMLPPAHYREKKGIKRPSIDALFNDPQSEG